MCVERIKRKVSDFLPSSRFAGGVEGGDTFLNLYQYKNQKVTLILGIKNVVPVLIISLNKCSLL